MTHRYGPANRNAAKTYQPAATGYTLDELSALMRSQQVKYNRLHFADFARELAPRPVTITQKLQLPEHFTSLFPSDTALSTIGVSGKHLSFWHAFLSVVLPEFINNGWLQRKVTIERFIDELEHSAIRTLNDDQYGRIIGVDSVKYYEACVSSPLCYYLCLLFGINIIIVDNVGKSFYHTELTFDTNKPTVTLYQDDSPLYYPVAINNNVLIHGKTTDAMCLLSLAPEINQTLSEHITMPKSRSGQAMDLYQRVNKISDSERYAIEQRPILNGLKLRELQELADKLGISTKNKQTRAELIDLIISHGQQQ